MPLLAVALLAAGGFFAVGAGGQEEFGWFACPPRCPSCGLPRAVVVMDAEKWAGVVLAGLGLLTLAFWSGFRAGHARRHPG